MKEARQLLHLWRESFSFRKRERGSCAFCSSEMRVDINADCVALQMFDQSEASALARCAERAAVFSFRRKPVHSLISLFNSVILSSAWIWSLSSRLSPCLRQCTVMSL